MVDTTYCAYCTQMVVDLQDRSVGCERGFRLIQYEDGFKRRCGVFELDNKIDTRERQKDLVVLGFYLPRERK